MGGGREIPKDWGKNEKINSFQNPKSLPKDRPQLTLCTNSRPNPIKSGFESDAEGSDHPIVLLKLRVLIYKHARMKDDMHLWRTTQKKGKGTLERRLT
uniref:Uncharacterized protein n=1 Tax=Solanum lycopersicum TaxID=4081 RepID=A0A3Q7EXB3_SOLLC